jgi:hypothetical protein
VKVHQARHLGSTRVHALILTRDRTAQLRLAVKTALSTMSPEDALTVLDDSCAETAHANSELLSAAASRSRTRVVHLKAEKVHDLLGCAHGRRRARWQMKTAPRDIAPLRNLTLLLSRVIGAQTTVLLDDDICAFDLAFTHRLLNALKPGPEGVIVGAQLVGTTEQDTVTRLSDAMDCLEVGLYINPPAIDELFRVHPDADCLDTNNCRWVSAGYLAFRLPPEKFFAFPPGYNEDWLWCLLHDAGGNTPVLRLDQRVVHQPPLLRRSTSDDVLFELQGDLILDCLAEPSNQRPRQPETVLRDIIVQESDRTSMPYARAESLLEHARKLSANGQRETLTHLERYGLSVLRGMLASGKLHVNPDSVLGHWSSDAAAKHRSFANTLRTEVEQRSMAVIWHDGRV